MVGLGLGLGLGLGSGGGGSRQPPLPGELLCDAIARKMCVTATVKNKAQKLAPHAVYPGQAAGVLLVDCLTVEREGKASNRKRLDAFDVADLQGLALTADVFTVVPGFDPAKYAGQAICIVEVI